eukprot:4337784-Alexandrium_andersonii.AAC.1
MKRPMATWVAGSLEKGVGEPVGGVRNEQMGETLEAVVDGSEHVHNRGRTDRWRHVRMGGWVERWLDGWVDGQMEGRMDARVGRRLEVWRVDTWAHGWMGQGTGQACDTVARQRAACAP